MELRIPYPELKEVLYTILVGEGFDEQPARHCAEVFATNSLEGVYSHGVNRFPKFVDHVRQGYIKPNSHGVVKHRSGAVEQWDGQNGPGPVNASMACDRAMELAGEHGLGCVAMAHTNHWLRGGTYAWKAAKAGFAYLAWTNTIANMPPWGAKEARLGNNPLIIGVPHEDEAVVLDMAVSQYSFGALNVARQRGEELPLPGGYDKAGNLTSDPVAIIDSQRPLPVGYWKGAGLSLVLDLLATVLSGGLSTAEVTAQGDEHNVSQVFMAIYLKRLHNYSTLGETIRGILDDYASAEMVEAGGSIRYPGQQVLAVRDHNLTHGVPVFKETWETVQSLKV